MTEVEPKIEVKPEAPKMHPVEQYRRSLKKMTNRQLSGHLKRRALTTQCLDGALAVILSAVFENRNKISSALR